MTQEVESKFSNGIPGGLSMLNMDSASNRSSWAGNIYQKWETICLDNIFDQKQRKYVNVIGDQIRKILDEVANDWLNPPDGCVEGPVSDLSLEHNVISEICERSKVGPDELPNCIELESYVSSANRLTSGSFANHSRDLDQNNENNVPVINDSTRSNSPIDCGEGCARDSDSVASVAYRTSFLPLMDEISQLDLHQNRVMEGESMLLDCTLPKEINGSHVSGKNASPSRSLEDENELESELNILQASEELAVTAMTESTAGFDGDVMLNVRDVIDASTDLADEFEDVKMEDFYHDFETHELSLSSQWVPKNISYKRKFKYACSSKLSSRKWYGGNNLEMCHRPRISASSVSSDALYSKTMSADNSCDPDWVFILRK